MVFNMIVSIILMEMLGNKYDLILYLGDDMIAFINTKIDTD